MPYEDIYNPDTSRYQGDFSSSLATAPPLSINPTTAYYGGYMDKGDLQASTSTLREVAGTLRSVLGQFTGAVSATFSTLRNLYASQTRPQETRQPIVQPYISPEAGRYVGSATFLESARGALTGRPTSPYILKSDYQQLMSEDFAKRSTLLGGSVAGVGTEIGAGWLGSKVLGPMIGKGLFGSLAGGFAGYMGAGYLTSHVMGRINQGMEFDSLLKDTSSRLGINEGGALSKGFSSSTRRKMAKEFRGGGLKTGDYADIMEYGTEYGLFQGVTTPEQFTETVKSAAKQIKVLMKVLRETDVRDAIKDVATFRQWGVPQGQMVSFAMHADAVGRAVGLTSQGVMGHMAGGAQMAQQRGMLGATGAGISAYGLLAARSMLKSGVVSPDDMARATRGGGENEYAQQLAWGMERQTESFSGKYLLAAMSKKGEKGKYVIDEDVQKRYLSGEISSAEMARIAGKKMRADISLADKIINRPRQLREEIIPDTHQWYTTLSKSVQRDVDSLMASNRQMSREQAMLVVTNARAGSSEEGESLRNFIEDTPGREGEVRKTKSTERIKTAIEAAKGKQGLSAKWKSVKDTAWGYTIGGFDKHIIDPIVDSALDVKDTIARKSTDFAHQKWWGLHISAMPGAMPEGYASPGQLSPRVERVVSQTRARAAMAKTKEGEEGAASVIADTMKDEIEGLGSTNRSFAGLVKSPGKKLIDAGAYQHMDVYTKALTAVSQGTSQEEYLKKISEEYKSPEKAETSKKLYEILKEALKNKTLAEDQMIEQLELMNRLYKEGQKTGVFQPGEIYSTQQANYPVESVSAPKPSRWQPSTDDRMNPLVDVDRIDPRYADRRRQSAEDKARRESRRAEAEEKLRLATLSPEEADSLGGPLLDIRSQPDKHKHTWLYSPTDADIYGMRDTSTSPESTRVETPDPDKVYKKPSRWDTRAARKERSKSDISQPPHSGTRPDEAVPEYWRLYTDDKDDTLSQHTSFDAWRSKWGAVSYDDVNHPITKSKLTPDTMGQDLFSVGGHIDTKEDFARKGMVEVAKGKWVSASMAPHYGKGFSANAPQSPDINTQDATGSEATPGTSDASKALGSSQGGLAQNAEKTSKTLEKVNKGLDGFLSRLSRSFLGAARNSNY